MTAFALALLSLDGVGRVTAWRLLERFGSAQAVRESPREQVLLRLKGVAHAERTVDAVVSPDFDQVVARAEAQVEALAAKKIAVLTPGASAWPAGLMDLPRAERPVVLYAFGDLKALAWPSLAVLAAAPLDAGPFETVQEVARQTLAQGRGIVTGAATGIDLALQKLSLAAQIPAVAVVGSGLARLAPAMRPGATALTRAGGLLVSPFDMTHGPFDHDDRQRALVQAALGRAVCAAAAPPDSPESRATRWAADAGRPLASVGPVDGAEGALAVTDATAGDVAGLVA